MSRDRRASSEYGTASHGISLKYCLNDSSDLDEGGRGEAEREEEGEEEGEEEREGGRDTADGDFGDLGG